VLPMFEARLVAIWKDGAWTLGVARRLDPPPPPYSGSYRQLAAARSNPLISAITRQVVAVSCFPSPSLISANLCQLLLDLRISPPSPNLCYLLAAPGSPRQLPAVPSIPFISGINLQLLEVYDMPFSFLISAKP
jgi:hypothetical protein